MENNHVIAVPDSDPSCIAYPEPLCFRFSVKIGRRQNHEDTKNTIRLEINH